MSARDCMKSAARDKRRLQSEALLSSPSMQGSGACMPTPMVSSCPHSCRQLNGSPCKKMGSKGAQARAPQLGGKKGWPDLHDTPQQKAEAEAVDLPALEEMQEDIEFAKSTLPVRAAGDQGHAGVVKENVRVPWARGEARASCEDAAMGLQDRSCWAAPNSCSRECYY
ncbi:hypothetical protein L7F22_023891 [Adiantum nelumboides]|nr:hypothetical protein [Adiantum nelumboides]